ncbi:peptide chain release factor N(5)-glutamine methyltransferase [Streptococcus pseudoporcinus]|uniref:Release factor glutamine methyltransferase n=1 Tax=Streptococcus pseudoporcinus LQ 940-04 TaxID=875093 RepID=G5KBS0_9STRE|nr:peptide chain release factor N(5)-glutamine methyltransferase [Streptococcus pseudoporcinus]EFR45322.1 protein-(glutamine-N5) methyltransferase, release factor-specific [Streptococcus pseudoporcinus SPIN 20026]EHI64687.1 protein-(glutamine-N5) methyltransferase, release factor-specific [Streptococcus pseudoporcinus LQ 940-04]VEF92922.1 methyltransferase [Streptococcus pseudoporcinus]
MNYASQITEYEHALAQIGDDPENLSYVFREVKEWSLLDFLLHQNKQITAEDQVLLKSIFEQLYRGRSPQYITGKAYFRELILTVNESVLIPRPETEELVELILAENKRHDLQLLDIGTGSGAIAISLKKERPSWKVTASDISLEALEVAQINALKNGTDIMFSQSDLFSSLSGKFDIIVSNPPYIAFADKEEVGRNVLASEPHLALFAEEEGLAIYRSILEQAEQYLSPQGKLYFEIGYKQGQALFDLVKTNFPEKRFRLKQDCYGKDRMVIIDNG